MEWKGTENCELLWKMAQMSERSHQFGEAADIYLHSAQIKLKKGAKEDASMQFFYAGRCLYRLKDWDGALKCCKQSLEIADQLGILKGKLININLIGQTLHEKRDLDGAMKYYKEALEIAEQLGDSGMRALILKNIGYILHPETDPRSKKF